ncbi:hypothetical protein ANDA3_0026 [plant metagenome]|uniref:Uncharacterized protein n=1 Tax=plant metagenome TaxID=1297885 RepID=A0A484PJJ1_9ZZZZ
MSPCGCPDAPISAGAWVLRRDDSEERRKREQASSGMFNR